MMVGFFVGIVLIILNPYNEASLCDMMWAINAARDLWAGRDPYRHTPSINLVPYPLTSAIIVFPIALFPSAIGLTIPVLYSQRLPGLCSDSRWLLLAIDYFRFSGILYGAQEHSVVANFCACPIFFVHGTGSSG